MQRLGKKSLQNFSRKFPIMEAIFRVGIFPEMRNSYALKFNHIMTLQGFSFIPVGNIGFIWLA